MKKFADNLWKYGCVPLTILGSGIILHIIYHAVWLIFGTNTAIPYAVKLPLSIILILFGMFLLRNKPKKELAISSAVACIISLAIELSVLFPALRPLWGTLSIYGISFDTIAMFLFSELPSLFIGQDAIYELQYNKAYIIAALSFEVLLPLAYVASGLFSRIGRRPEK